MYIHNTYIYIYIPTYIHTYTHREGLQMRPRPPPISTYGGRDEGGQHYWGHCNFYVLF